MLNAFPVGASFPGPLAGLNQCGQGEQEQFNIQSCRARVVNKAGYKSRFNGQMVKVGWGTWLKTRIQGNDATARYKRAAFDSSQRITAAWLAQQHLNYVKQVPVDMADSALLKNRFYRQDNLRTNSAFGSKRMGLSADNQRAAKLARWAHHSNGVTEICVAPTGLFLKISKILFTPNRDDRAMGSQLRALAALPVIAAVLSTFLSAVFSNGLGRLLQTASLQFMAEVRAMVLGCNAVAALASGVSLGCTAISTTTVSHTRLSPETMSLIENNKRRHIHRIHTLLRDIQDKPGATRLVALALLKKIPAGYCVNKEMPWLLERLNQVVKANNSFEETEQAIEQTLGSYLCEYSVDGDTPWKVLDPVKDRAELLRRENHVLALTNLIEHASVDQENNPDLKDCRNRIEDGAAYLRSGVLKGSAKALNALGFQQASGKANFLASKEYLEQREADRKNPSMAWQYRYSSDYMLDNLHQYGSLTRGLVRASEALRIFNHHVLLSINYQLTRPIAAAVGFLTEAVFRIPNSRSTSFTVGRSVASSILATLDAVFFLSLSAGQGMGFNGPESSTRVEFPLEVELGKWNMAFSVMNTAVHMLIVGIPAGLLMAAAKGACSVEGWKGNISRPYERSCSKRQPLRWE